MSPAEKIKTKARQTLRQPGKSNIKPSSKSTPRHVRHQPIIVRTTEKSMQGIHSFETSRCVVGYVVSGYKHLYRGDQRTVVSAGELFFLNNGTHFIEDVPDGRPFEELLFFFTPDQIGRVIANLNINYGLETGVRHSCEVCRTHDHIVGEAGKAFRHFAMGIIGQLREKYFLNDPTAEMLALTVMVYQILNRPEDCLRTRLLNSTDPEKELMDRQMREFILMDISLEELARRNNRSLSSFKDKFKEYFGETPHNWVLRQRLMLARLQLIQTSKSMIQIGAECHFNNASHFSKSFRNEFGISPTKYRRKYLDTAETDAKALPREDYL